MATYDAELYPLMFGIDALQNGYAEPPVSITITGSGINPIPFYFLAMFDDLDIRHYWIDTYPSINNAPALGIGSYVPSTFVILGRF